MTESYDNPSTRPPGTLPTSDDLDTTLPPSYPAGSGTYETGVYGTTTYTGAHVADEPADTSGGEGSKVEQAKEKAGEVKDQVKGEAQNVAQTAAAAGSRVAGTAKEQAAQVAGEARRQAKDMLEQGRDRKSTRLNSSHANISYAVFCLKKNKIQDYIHTPSPCSPNLSCQFISFCDLLQSFVHPLIPTYLPHNHPLYCSYFCHANSSYLW